MTRRNRLTSQQAPRHNRRTADPYLMHQDREPRPADKYLNGDPDAWAETPMPAPAWPTPRNRVNMPEFADTTFDHKNEQGWGDEDGQDYDNGYTRKPSDDQGNRLAQVKSARRRARIALILATRMSGKRASASTLEGQAYSLMQLPMRDLVAMFRNLKAEDESDEDSDEEEAEEEVEDDKEARRRRARLQTELRRIAAEDESDEDSDEEVEAEDGEDEEDDKEARRRLARMRRRLAADDEEEAEEEEVEDEKEARRRQARMRKLNTELTRLASMDEDEEEATDDEEEAEEDEVEELEKEARRLAATLRIRKLKAQLRNLKAEDESDEDSDEEVEAEDGEDEEDDKEARRRQARNRKRVADDLMMDEEVEADEEDMSLEDMDQDMDDLMVEAEDDADMDALNALMAEEDEAEADEYFDGDDMGMTPELDLLGLDVEEPVVVAKKTRQASTQQVAPKRGVRSVGVRTAAQAGNPGKGGDAQLLAKLWDASPDVSAVFSRPKT